MGSLAPEKRVYPRLRPRGLVSLAIYQGERIPPAYAILNDISEMGVCVASDRVLARGQRVQLRIQFATEPDLFEAPAAVRWTRPLLAQGLGALTGIEFGPLASTSPRLRTLLSAPGFALLESRDEPFEDLLRELKPYLDRLGDVLGGGTTKTGA